MQQYTQHVGGKNARRDEELPGQVQNSSGAYVYGIDCWKRLDRFLILGSSEPTYYASAKKLTKENVKAIEECIKVDPFRTVQRISEVSHAGRAPNNDPALFALAAVVALGGEKARLAAMGALTSVARIGTHLFHFLQYATDLGQGWGRCFKNGVAFWFNEKSVEDLAYQAIKYKSRDGWSMRDVLRLAHPNPTHGSRVIQDAVLRDGYDAESRKSLYAWMAGKEAKELPAIIEAVAHLSDEAYKARVPELIEKHKIPREAVPTEMLNSPAVWETLLDAPMPMMALVRNLAKMTAVGLLDPMGGATACVIDRLRNREPIHNSRMHPIHFLKALMTYKQGHGERGKLTWRPVPKICDALDEAFYLAFDNVAPTGKRIFLALDVSGSMNSPRMDSLGCTPREAACAMAMVTNRSEKNAELFAFSSSMVDITISPRCRLDQFVESTARLPFSNTDCSLPMRFAAQNIREPIDAFVIYTDSETNSHSQIQPVVALRQYRQKTGVDAKLIVVGMTSNGFSIAPPDDGGCLDVVGMDTAVPQLISDFIQE